MDLHQNLIEVPASMLEMAHRLHPAATDLARENRPEPVPPEAHCLVCDVDPTLVEQVLHVPKQQRVTDIHHHRQADDLK